MIQAATFQRCDHLLEHTANAQDVLQHKARWADSMQPVSHSPKDLSLFLLQKLGVVMQHGERFAREARDVHVDIRSLVLCAFNDIVVEMLGRRVWENHLPWGWRNLTAPAMNVIDLQLRQGVDGRFKARAICAN